MRAGCTKGVEQSFRVGTLEGSSLRPVASMIHFLNLTRANQNNTGFPSIGDIFT